MRTTFTLWTIWCCFLVRAGFYCVAVPLWEGFDEHSHFALIQDVFTHHGRFPPRASLAHNSRQLSASRKLTPAAWTIHDEAAGLLSYEEFFDLPPAERDARRARLESLPQDWSRQEADPPEALYEAQQAPLYYWIMAPVYGFMQGWSIPRTILILRLLAAWMASAAIPLTFFVGRRVFRDASLALGASVMAASFPQIFIQIGHVGNEGLAVCAGGMFVLLAMRALDQKPSAWSGVWLGTALGAALLTKAYFLALLPMAGVVLWLAWRRNTKARAQAIRQSACALGACVAISGWWYAHNIITTGSVTGQFEDVQAMTGLHLSLAGAIRRAQWTRVFDFIATTQIWLGGWSFLGLRSWMYRLVELLAGLAIAGICTQIVRARSWLPRPRDLGVLALPYFSLIAGLCFYAAQVLRTRGIAVTPGYYVYALAVPIAILLAAGLARLLPFQSRALPVPCAAFILVAIEQFGIWFVMFPYYAGLIRHLANGALPAAHIQQYLTAALPGNHNLFFEHLSAIGPVSSPAAIETAAIFYGSATAILLWIACRIYVSSRGTAPATTF